MKKKELSGNTRPEKIKLLKRRLIREEHGSQVVTFGRNFFPPSWVVVSISDINNDSCTVKRLT